MQDIYSEYGVAGPEPDVVWRFDVAERYGDTYAIK